MADELLGPSMESALPEGTVTILFTDLVDSTKLYQLHGDDAANLILREVEQCAHELIDRHRGIVVKGTGDGLMVAFQSARRGVAYARELQLAVADRNRGQPAQQVLMRIGLHTGEVIAQSGDLHGETVYIAKRIEALAPAGGIFASETVHGVLGTARTELVDRGEFELKGIDAPWRLFEVPVVDDRADDVLADTERSPFVGRIHESELLAEQVARTMADQGGMVLVTGEAGAGKSRLIRETCELARERGMAVLVGHCLDMDAPPPYQPLVEQLEHSARALTPEAFRELLGEQAPEVARLMPELHRIYGDIGESPVLPPDQERRYLLHGVGRFVERAALRQPLLLCFEDLHWADESSLQLIAALAQLAPTIPLLLVASFRPGDVAPHRPLARTLEDLTRGRLAVEVRLGALSRDDVAMLLEGRAGRPAPPPLVSLVFDETEGNPFFVEEVFLHLKELGLLFDEDGGWRDRVAITDIDVPPTVRLVIERRLERVSDAARRVLTTAAVTGRSASFELLLATAGLEEDQLLDALEEAERATLVEAHERGGDALYAFVHEQIRQTLLADLSVPRRQRIHARIAAALQALLGADAERNAADIAHHLQLAGTAAPRETTLDFLEHAARNALAAVAPEDAIRHVGAALDLLGDRHEARRTELLAIQARAHRATAHIDAALSDLAGALALAPDGPPHDAILRQRAGLFLDLFDGQAAAADLESVLAAARARGDRVAVLDTLLALGRAHYVRALDDQRFAPLTRATYEEAYALAAEQGDRRAMIESLLPTVWFTDYWVDYTPVARANVEEAGRLADELGDEQLSLEVEAASLRFVRGPEAAELAERLRERLEARHDPVRLKEHYFWLMWHYLGRGELLRCVQTCDLGIELAGQLGSAPVQYGSIKALALTELGRYDLVDGALDDEVTDDDHPFGQANQAFARACYLGAIEAWEPAAFAALDAMQRGAALSRVWMQQGMLTVATLLRAHGATAVAKATAEVDAIADANGIRPTALARAEVELDEGRAAEARNGLERVVGPLSTNDFRRELTHALELLARALSDLGQWGNALDVCDRGLALCEDTGAVPMAWRLRGCRAYTLDQLGRSDEAADDRARANKEFLTLARRIPDPELQAWFYRQPLAARWLM